MFARKNEIIPKGASQENRVAIDVGLNAIKCAFLKDGELRLEEFPISQKPKDLLSLNRQELLANQRAAIFRALKLINPQAEFILSPQPSPQIITKIIHNPPDTDLRRYLKTILPFETDQFSFDIQEVGTSSVDKKLHKSDKKFSCVLATAADLDFIRTSIGLLGESQLQIKRVTPKGVALLNYLLLTSNGHGDQPLVFLDLGAIYSHLIVYKGRDRFLVRTIEWGGHHINRELVEKLNVDFETAEKIKTERELLGESLFASNGSSTSLSMYQAINHILFKLVDEIRNTMTYFEDYFVEDLADSFILLAGGTSKLKNLDRFLTKELQLPVKKVGNAVPNPTSEKQWPPQFTSTIGLFAKANDRGLLNLNLINHIEGLLFKLNDGDYYLTREGFVNKKKYKKSYRTKPLSPSISEKSRTDFGDRPLLPSRFVKNIPERIGALFHGERGVSGFRFSIARQIDLRPIKDGWKHLFILLGLLFLIVYGGNEFLWASKKNGLDRTINSYLTKSRELDRAKGAFLAAMGKTDLDSIRPGHKETRTDKIIWANKLKSLAAAIPEKVWISNLAIKGSPPSLNLYCHVYSTDNDHLKDIALFIKSLKDRTAFFQDFKDVKFHSAQRNSKDKNIYDFTLVFLLNREMIEEIQEPAVKAKAS